MKLQFNSIIHIIKLEITLKHPILMKVELQKPNHK